MYGKNQMLAVCLLHYFLFRSLTSATTGLELNHLKAEIFNHRVKRDGGALPFRPLFVYRQQEKEKQAKWKLEAEQKLAQQQYQLQNHQNSIEGYSKYQLSPSKSDYVYTYRYRPVYPTYQTVAQYQPNPTTYQLYQNSVAYPVSSYQNYPTVPYGSYSNYGFYANQRGSYYDYDYDS